jgi:HEXXH motif-containing protein
MHDPLVHALYVKREQKVLVNIVRLLQKLQQEAPALVERSGFAAALAHFSRYDSVTQKRILRYSSVRFWVDVAWGLVYKQAHVKFPELHIEMHLNTFWHCVLAAVTLTETGDFTCDIYTDVHGRVMLPGTQRYLEFTHADAYTQINVACVAGKCIYRSHAGVMDVVDRSIPVFHGIELNAVDMDHRLHNRASFEYEELTPQSLVRWEAVLDESLNWIAAANPVLYEEICAWTTAFVPVVSKSVDVHLSATFHQSPSIMALSWTPDSTVMSEAIVHEYHHQKLNALMDVTDLMTGAYSQAIYYSPWRPDPRPLSGIYHGAFVFQAVLEYWQCFVTKGIPVLDAERLKQRMHLVSYQTRAALTTLLDQAELTEIGRGLVEGMQVNLDIQSENLPTLRDGIAARIQEGMQLHRETWLEKNRGAQHSASLLADISREDIGSAATKTLRKELNVSAYTIELLPQLLQSRFVEDMLLTRIVKLHDESNLQGLLDALGQYDHESVILLPLVRGHIAYVRADYETAASAYAQVLEELPSSAYVWSLFAFALRHCDDATVQTAGKIFASIGVLLESPAGKSPDAVRERNDWLSQQHDDAHAVWSVVKLWSGRSKNGMLT